MLVSLIACAALVLGGCSADGGGAATGTTAPPSGGSDTSATQPSGGTETPQAIEVEEGLATVEVRVARSMVDPTESLSDEELLAAPRENGVTAVIEGDTVVFTMTKSQRDRMLTEMRSSIQDAADELVDDGANSVTAIDLSSAMNSFRVSVDAAKYGPMDGLVALGFYIQGALYQQFNGVNPDDIDVVVDFVDDATGETLDSGSFREMTERLREE